MNWEKFEKIVKWMDADFDDNVSQIYKDQPLAQDWARLAKVVEEHGEAVRELITTTGRNPRKPTEDRHQEMLIESADTAMSAIYAIQHFTKDIRETREVLQMRAFCHAERRGALSQWEIDEEVLCHRDCSSRPSWVVP